MGERRDDSRRPAVPGVLDFDEMLDMQVRFGVAEEQVRRDHVISHALAALSAIDDTRIVFFGGTALSRTLLPSLRLSEDIDLIALGPRHQVASDAQQLIEQQLSTTLGRPSFTPAMTRTARTDPSVMQVGDVRVQVQLLLAP